MGGFVGFDYSALAFLFKVKEVPDGLWDYALDNIDMLTAVASKYWNKKED
jgi:hypothetical protein